MAEPFDGYIQLPRDGMADAIRAGVSFRALAFLALLPRLPDCPRWGAWGMNIQQDARRLRATPEQLLELLGELADADLIEWDPEAHYIWLPEIHVKNCGGRGLPGAVRSLNRDTLKSNVAETALVAIGPRCDEHLARAESKKRESTAAGSTGSAPVAGSPSGDLDPQAPDAATAATQEALRAKGHNWRLPGQPSAPPGPVGDVDRVLMLCDAHTPKRGARLRGAGEDPPPPPMFPERLREHGEDELVELVTWYARSRDAKQWWGPGMFGARWENTLRHARAAREAAQQKHTGLPWGPEREI